jgi:hypothetical protein
MGHPKPSQPKFVSSGDGGEQTPAKHQPPSKRIDELTLDDYRRAIANLDRSHSFGEISAK